MRTTTYTKWRWHRLGHRCFRLSIGLVMAATFMVSAHGATTLEHVDGVPSWASHLSMSGNGQTAVWIQNHPPDLGIVTLSSGTATTVDLEVTTGFGNLQIRDYYLPAISDDGSTIALRAEIDQDVTIIVVSPTGTLLGRLIGTDNNDEAWFGDEVFIDGSGRYVIFATDANKLDAGGVKLYPTGNVDNTYRMDIQTGAIKMVGTTVAGGEPNGDVDPLGISSGGRYVLFKSSATNLPGANGETHVYVRDMNSSSTVMVSVDETGTPISSLACCYTVPNISDDGNRVTFTENLSSSSDGEPHTFLWERGVGSRELTLVTGEYDIVMSGDGQWLTARNEVFSRLEINTDATDQIHGHDTPNPAGISDPIFSDDGQFFVFFNQVLSRPPGEDGRWWSLSFDPPAPDTTPPVWPNGAVVNINQVNDNLQISWPVASDDTAVATYIVYLDDTEIAQVNAPSNLYTDTEVEPGTYSYRVEASDAAGNTTEDGPAVEYTVLPTIVVALSETIRVSDSTGVLRGITVGLNETITVSDSVLVLPAIEVSFSETITVNDDSIAKAHATPSDLINLVLPGGPIRPGTTFTADADGFKPFTPVQAFLQSEPVLVGTEIADIDGHVTFVITIPADFPAGDHSLILLGQNFDGSERRLTTPIVVDLPELIFRDSFE